MVGIMLDAFNTISWNDGRYSINRKYSIKADKFYKFYKFNKSNKLQKYMRNYHFMNFMCLMCFMNIHDQLIM